MAEAVLQVAFAGPLVSLQDAGRPGFMRFGVAASGPMDRKAHAIANRALGQAMGATAIEVSLGGLVLDCLSGAVTMAAAGGGFILQVDGEKRAGWRVFTLHAGQRLSLRRGPWGSWATLAVLGDLRAPCWLGSRATHAPSGLGGGMLQTGQTLIIDNARIDAALHRNLACPVWARPRQILHAVPGPQDRFFAPEVLADFATATFGVTAAYDRMGMRLDGPALPPVAALSIPSEPILRGAVQVSGDGTATVLLADHQTTGGYPKIATVLGDDLDAFVQCRPGQAVRFRLIAPENAIALTRHRHQITQRFLSGLCPAQP